MREDKTKVSERLSRMVERAEDALRTDKADAARFVKLVHGVLPRKRKGRSNIFVRKAHAYVESAVARYAAAQFQYSPFFDLESRTGSTIQRADNAEKILQFFLERADLPTKSVGWFKQSTTERLGVMKLGWRKWVRDQRQRMALDEAVKTVKDFKLPEELANIHIFLSGNGDVALDENQALVTHEGDGADETSALWEGQGYQRVTLDKAPPEVQNQFTVVVKAPKVLYDGLELTPIDFQDFFFDPDASSVEEIRYAGHFFGRSLADLKAEQKSGIPYKNLKELEDWALNSGTVPDLARYRRRDDIGKSNATTYSEQGTILKCTELWDIQEGRLYTWVATGETDGKGYDGIKIREEDHPFWHNDLPYHLLPASIVPFELVGVSIPELIEHLVHERNDIRNMAMDIKSLILMAPWLVNTDFVKDLRKFQNIEPNRVIELEGIDGNIPLANVAQQVKADPMALQNAEFLIRQIDQDMEEITGVSKTTQGIPIQRRTTYSEQSLLVNESNMRFRLQIMNIDRVMKRLARQALKLLDQFLDPQVEIRITDDAGNQAFPKYDREDLSYEYDVFPASSSVESLATKQGEANLMIQAYAAIRGSPMEAILKPIPFAREFWRKQGIKNVESFLKSDEELQQEQAQAQQQAMMQQQGQMQQGQAQPQQPPDESELIQAENEAMMQGQVPPVEPNHNHPMHAEGHNQVYQALMQELGDEQTAMQDPRMQALIEHLNQHAEFLGGVNETSRTDGTPQA